MNNLSMFPSRDTEYDDGDEGGSSGGPIMIDPVDNGYLLRIESDDGDIKRVFLDKKELLKYLNGVL